MAAPLAGSERRRPRVVSDLSRAHVAALVGVLREGPAARAELAERLGLSAGAVTRLVGRLLDADFVHELDDVPRSATRGRPRRPLALRSDRRVILAAHIGANRTSVGVVDLAGHVTHATEHFHRDLTPSAVLAATRSLLRRTVKQVDDSGTRVVGTGIGIGGWVDQGRVVEHPGLGWVDVDVQRRLAGAAVGPLSVESHVRGLALAEADFGAALGTDTLVELHVGNVTDAAVLVGGRLLRGPLSAAGSVGHLPVRADGEGVVCPCGRHGCAQVELSEARLLERARADGLSVTSVSDVDTLAASGDPRASALRDDRLAMIGMLSSHLVDVVGPDRLVLAGLHDLGERDLDIVRRAAIRRPDTAGPHPEIVASDLGDHPLLLAAAAPPLLAWFDDPTAAEPDLSQLAAPSA